MMGNNDMEAAHNDSLVNFRSQWTKTKSATGIKNHETQTICTDNYKHTYDK